jgi:hypothetical protein
MAILNTNIGDLMPSFSSTAAIETELAAALNKKSTISPDEACQAKRQLNACQLNSVQRKELLVSAMTIATGGPQAGRRTKALNAAIVRRGVRPFTDQRERQLLKHVSTQIYFALEQWMKNADKKEKIVEVQMMHLQHGNKNFLFVSVNETSASQHLKHIIGTTPDHIKTMLTTPYEPKRNVEGKRRSKSYSKKLSARLFGETIHIPKSTDSEDTQRAKQIAEQLRYPWKMWDININFREKVETLLNHGESGVYVLDHHLYHDKTRHAEEFLVDIAEIAIASGETYSCIGGKKRPCLSCYGRMFSVINVFNPRPGLLWLHAAGRQETEVFKRTAQALLTQLSHVSEDGRGYQAKDFDSASESEAETESKSIKKR